MSSFSGEATYSGDGIEGPAPAQADKLAPTKTQPTQFRMALDLTFRNSPLQAPARQASLDLPYSPTERYSDALCSDELSDHINQKVTSE
jgi:hypothetical protein